MSSELTFPPSEPFRPCVEQGRAPREGFIEIGGRETEPGAHFPTEILANK